MNYIGSKQSLLPFLEQTISAVIGVSDGNTRGGVFADPFAGTGAVGAAFRSRGFTVIANDIQHYSYALNRHFVENPPSLNVSHLEYLNALDGTDGFVYRNYCAGSNSGRNYFTDENGRRCDAIRGAIERLRNDGEIGDDEYFYYLASLINSVDKVANTASVYGAFLKHVKKTAQKPFAIELLPRVDGPRGEAHCADASELIRTIRGDVLYLDPPYNARQYSANYHVLETISRYDNPALRGKTGMRDVKAQKSAFCSKRTVAQALDEVLANADFKYIFLSYNNEGLMSLDAIREIMARHGEYSLFTQEYRRFRADKQNARNHKADATVEHLHVCVK